MPNQGRRAGHFVLISALLAGCGGGDTDSTATPLGGGGAGTATGGATASTGGAVVQQGSGGAPVHGNGGAPVTGAAGATVSAGGAPSNAGGASATGGAGTAGAAAGTGGATSGGTLPPVTSVDQDGPYTVTIDQNAGANSWVFRPTELGKDGVKHPIFVWGTGATSVPSQYKDHLSRIASHGFVAISPNSSSVTAALLKASLDWILGENDKQDSVYYQKLLVSKVAMGGHSLGSIGTFDEEATETRLTTTIHIAGGSFDGKGSSKVKTPTAYICGANGDIAQPQCKVDFQNVGTQPTFYSELKGIDHVGAARAALPGMVAWLRWHLAGEVERKAMFTGPDGQFFKDIWTSQTKNW